MSVGKSPLPVPCPYPSSTLQPPPPPTSFPSSLLLLQARCIPPLCLLAYLVPAVLPARPSISLSPTGSGQGLGSSGPEGPGERGGERSRSHCQCYFEPLTGAASERETPCSAGCSGPGHAGECPSDPHPEMPQTPHVVSSFRKGGAFLLFPRCG